MHRYGVLAVPRNAFLQPEALVELLDDHREEVRMRVAERRREADARAVRRDDRDRASTSRHLEATFDPATCASCTLFAFCRDELRDSTDPADLLIEIGVPPRAPPARGRPGRRHRRGRRRRRASVRAQVLATVDGVGRVDRPARVDPVGQPGTVNVVLAKSDSAALGVHGIAVQRVTATGAGEWQDDRLRRPAGRRHPPRRSCRSSAPRSSRR